MARLLQSLGSLAQYVTIACSFCVCFEVHLLAPRKLVTGCRSSQPFALAPYAVVRLTLRQGQNGLMATRLVAQLCARSFHMTGSSYPQSMSSFLHKAECGTHRSQHSASALPEISLLSSPWPSEGAWQLLRSIQKNIFAPQRVVVACRAIPNIANQSLHCQSGQLKLGRTHQGSCFECSRLAHIGATLR